MNAKQHIYNPSYNILNKLINALLLTPHNLKGPFGLSTIGSLKYQTVIMLVDLRSDSSYQPYTISKIVLGHRIVGPLTSSSQSNIPGSKLP